MKLKNIKNVSDQSITLSKYLWVHNCKIIRAVIAFFFSIQMAFVLFSQMLSRSTFDCKFYAPSLNENQMCLTLN